MSKNIGKSGKEMNDSEIDLAFAEFTIRSERMAKKAVKRAANLYAGRLRQNAPRDENKEGRTFNGEYEDPRHSADFIKVGNTKLEGASPSAQVGFLKTKGLGWYMHFPDGGTVVRGSLHQPAQNFIEKTIRETQGPILALFKYELRKAARK